MPRELTPEEIKAKFGKGKTSPAGTAVVKIEAIPEPMGPIMRAASAPVVVGRPPEMETEGTEGLREGGKPASADATWTPEEQKTNKAAGKKKGGKAA